MKSAPASESVISRMVAILASKGPMRAGMLGAELWVSRNIIMGKPENQLLTMYARPAGRLLARARKLHLVHCVDHGKYRLWHASKSA